METQVILVDPNDQPLGSMEKMAAHRQGLLHRAFSIFIFNNKGEMLLQQRSAEKYHSPGLWTNACCSHPVPGEETSHAAQRRLQEELGFETEIEKVFDLLYKTSFDNGLTEHEFDHVFAGLYEGPIHFDTSEVMAVSYRGMEEIARSLQSAPGQFTVWFRLAFPGIQTWWNERFGDHVKESV